jgi:hypothetical protein
MSGRLVWIAPGTWAPLKQVAADPRRRAEALANAQRHHARRKYLSLVEAFSEYDARDGATPLVERAAAKAPPRRIYVRDQAIEGRQR